MTSSTVPYTVLGGYLGAGKTTLLNRLLHDNQGTRIALLINDFGAINIDASLVESKTDQQINLTNGCVCCGLSDGFDEAIAGLLTSPAPPEHIVVEASGVADVQSLAQYGNAPGLSLDAIVVVADALTVRQKANDKYVANTIRRQLGAADLVLLNKVDLIDTAQLAKLTDWLNTQCNNAPIVPTEFCALPQALLLGNTGKPRLGTSVPHLPQNSRPAEDMPGGSAHLPGELTPSHSHTEAYVTWNHRSAHPLEDTQVQRFLQDLPSGVLRGKGFFNTPDGRREWHQVGKQQRLTPVKAPKLAQVNEEQPTTLVAIGLAQELDTSQLDALAAEHLSRRH